jgi:Cyclophilin-like family
MTMRLAIAITAALVTLTASACGTSDDADTSSATSTTVSPTPSSTSTPSQPSATTASTTPSSATAQAEETTIVRFTSNDTSVDVTIGADNAAIRDFLSMLPLTLRFEEFNGRVSFPRFGGQVGWGDQAAGATVFRFS